MRVRYTSLVLGLWLGVRLYTMVAPGMRRGYVFFSPQGKGHGPAVYDSFDIDVIAKLVI